jgi:hypothetical protein
MKSIKLLFAIVVLVGFILMVTGATTGSTTEPMFIVGICMLLFGGIIFVFYKRSHLAKSGVNVLEDPQQGSNIHSAKQPYLERFGVYPQQDSDIHSAKQPHLERSGDNDLEKSQQDSDILKIILQMLAHLEFINWKERTFRYKYLGNYLHQIRYGTTDIELHISMSQSEEGGNIYTIKFKNNTIRLRISRNNDGVHNDVEENGNCYEFSFDGRVYLVKRLFPH